MTHASPRARGAPRHLPAIDGLRGVAIALVVCHHLSHFFPLGGALHELGERGFAGVDLFFSLSGYLITTILIHGRGTRRQLRVFWIRRALRIFPLAYLYLGVLFVAHQVLGWPERHVIAGPVWAAALTYTSNLWYAAHGWPVVGSLAILWSLSIEEQFYLVWPLLAKLLSPSRLAIAALGVVVAAPFAREWAAEEWGNVAFLVLTPGRTDGLALGALLAIACTTDARGVVLAASRRLFVPAIVLALWLAGRPLFFEIDGRTWDNARTTGLALTFTVMVAASIEPTASARRVLASPFLRRLGELSYGMYVWHYFLLLCVRRAVPEASAHPYLASLGSLALIWAVSALSHRFYEGPFLTLKDRWGRA